MAPHSSLNGNHFSINKLVAISTMLSPSHHQTHFNPIVQAGGGDAASEIPVQQLFLLDQIQDHLRRVYTSISRPNESLSRAKFQAWLADVQGIQTECLDKEEYKFGEFLQTLHHTHGLEAIREARSQDKDLTHPLSNYFISSSHNTYLSGNQLSSKSSTEAYKNVLIRGCRCIEIDVHNGEPAQENKSSDNLPTQHSPRSPSASKSEHKRHISGSILSSRAAAAFERAEEKLDHAKKHFAEKTGFGKELSNNDERGRKRVTSNSLDIGKDSTRPSPSRSLRNGEPLVLHGWTLTAPIGFRAVCRSIRETAFLTSQLPIIVSLEVHADPEQQEVMVDIMREEWKGYLVEKPHEGCNPSERLPRLEELMNKILIKAKKASVDKQEATKQQVTSVAAKLAPAASRTDADSTISASDDERANAKKKVRICENLSNLSIYTHSEHFVSFEAKAAKAPPHIFSISESQIIELHEAKKAEMIAHNRDFFMRAYPAGFRIDSSNLDPSTFWRKGVQMVALNWQTLDDGMMLNEGMFAGEHGWVLKPSGYRSDATEPVDYKSIDLKITILAGQHIPVPENQTEKNFNPYVRCELHIEREQERTAEQIKIEDCKKKTPYRKGDHPDFGPEGFELQFPHIAKVVEELSFLKFKIEDARYAKDNLAAWACIRLDRLQQGYRFVRLLDAKGQATAGILLVKIEKRVVNWK